MTEPVLLKGVWDLGPPTEAHRLWPPEAMTIIHEGRHAGTGEAVSVALGDGSSRWITKETSQATLRAAITRNGGETLGAD